jgi:hypothetical protein
MQISKFETTEIQQFSTGKPIGFANLSTIVVMTKNNKYKGNDKNDKKFGLPFSNYSQ